MAQIERDEYTVERVFFDLPPVTLLLGVYIDQKVRLARSQPYFRRMVIGIKDVFMMLGRILFNNRSSQVLKMTGWRTISTSSTCRAVGQNGLCRFSI